MKKIGLSLVAAAAIIFASCGGNSSNTVTSSEQTVAEAQGDNYAVDLATSKVDWKAFHKGGFAPRWGTLALSSGELSVDGSNVTAGEFTIDMKSLKVDSASVTEADKKSSDLENHLKNADFFDVEKFATAAFKITQISDLQGAAAADAIEGANKTVSGNLTLLDSTLNISFPAKITVEGEKVAVAAKFTVNRADWGIKFGTSEGDPSEWMISKDIEIGINVNATKK
ncbi:YceI family protein [Sphingobacterium oryzagri]|uniref:YceI family protein n=1 Tax=Sphingobacterium oryzagri TaxID=3025669 RepID=A0ABY7WP15_9SPHI|nr:YceI family protein [Sphingobacterium sp. KACC 22765]WDF70785.1 YceI family protein [Sphingobacterium sp. KACC 22765]